MYLQFAERHYENKEAQISEFERMLKLFKRLGCEVDYIQIPGEINLNISPRPIDTLLPCEIKND